MRAALINKHFFSLEMLSIYIYILIKYGLKVSFYITVTNSVITTIPCMGSFHILSPEEYSFSGVIRFYLLVTTFIMFILFCVYTIYTKGITYFHKSPVKYIINGFKAYDLPKWWTHITSTWPAFFIRIIGPICLIIVRSILPYNADIKVILFNHLFIACFVYIVYFVFVVYVTIGSLCHIWSGLHYLWNLGFVHKNSPVDFGKSMLQLSGTLLKVSLGLAGSGIIIGSSISGFDDFQRNVFNASDNQLLSTNLKTVVDSGKKITGYNDYMTSRVAKANVPAVPSDSKIVKLLKDSSSSNKLVY